MNINRIEAPFTEQQVFSLQLFQQDGHFHPFCCMNGRDERHLDGEGLLVPTVDGFICPYCDYKQTWCHGFMAEYVPRAKTFDKNK